MPTSHENALQQRCQQIVTSPVLSPEQKRHFLALEAENNLPYPALPAEARRALDEAGYSFVRLEVADSSKPTVLI